MVAKYAIKGAQGLLLLCSLACGATQLFANDTTMVRAPMPPTLDTLWGTDSAPQPGSSAVLPASYASCSSAECADVACDEQCGEQCGGCSGDPCGCCRPCRLWVRADYLLWTTRGVRLPTLVTTSPIGVQPPGAIGAPTTTVLFGNEWTNNDARSGYRITMGYWFRCCSRLGIESDYFDLGGQTARYYASSTGEPVLARPFYDSVNEIQTSVAIAYPGLVTGDIDVRSFDYFQSTGVDLRYNLYSRAWYGVTCCDDCGDDCGEGCDSDCNAFCCIPQCCRLDLIGGYRYNRLDDRVTIRDREIATDSQEIVPPGTIFDLDDSFRAHNNFHGGELGLIAHIERGCWSFEFLLKAALGNNRQTVWIDGSTAITVPDSSTVNYTGALLALPSNIGTYSRDKFVVIPQLGVEVGYQLTCGLRAYVGYNFLYWANVMRAAHAIDLDINPAQIPPSQATTPPPTFSFSDTDFWAHGINLGLELCY